jgi:hypothetical protein
VSFATNVSSYGDEVEAKIDVCWDQREWFFSASGHELPGRTVKVVRTIEDKAFDCELNGLMAQVMGIEDPGED